MEDDQIELDPQVEDLDPAHVEKFLQDSRDFLEPFLDTEVLLSGIPENENGNLCLSRMDCLRALFCDPSPARFYNSSACQPG